MDDKLCVVQFLHPGGEHAPDGGPHMPWNTGPHPRKFLISPGDYVVGNELSRTHHAELTFWGEWEPQSEVAPFGPPYPGAPQYLHRPYYVLPLPSQQVQNTDPFVFGDRFRYTYCLQKTVFGPTQLQRMAHGSVILFGSCIGKSQFEKAAVQAGREAIRLQNLYPMNTGPSSSRCAILCSLGRRATGQRPASRGGRRATQR